MRHMYGLGEKQFRTLFEKAQKLPGIAGENFMFLLESRLDNLVYRLGFANSRAGARQLVSHGHVTVNGKKVDIASFRVSVGDVISLRERSRGLSSIKEALENRTHLPAYLEYNDTAMEGKLIRLPERSSCRKTSTRSKSSSSTTVKILLTQRAQVDVDSGPLAVCKDGLLAG